MIQKVEEEEEEEGHGDLLRTVDTLGKSPPERGRLI